MRHSIKWAAGLMATAAVTASGLVGMAGTASADSTGRVPVEVCANGNYTAYAKWVGGGLSQDETHAAPGTCITDSILVPQPAAASQVYLFGLYNISGKGFDVVSSGRPIVSNEVATATSKILLHATGTTTDPHWSIDLWGTFGHIHESE